MQKKKVLALLDIILKKIMYMRKTKSLYVCGYPDSSLKPNKKNLLGGLGAIQTQLTRHQP